MAAGVFQNSNGLHGAAITVINTAARRGLKICFLSVFLGGRFLITAKGLTRKYGEFTAVNDVSFTIPNGQVVGLLGHNGAGKTTIMKMLTGFIEPTSGTATIDGLDIVVDRLAVQEKVGYLPEVSPLYPELTVAEYLEYVAALRGIPSQEVVGLIKEAVERTSLATKLTAQISTLSKGYKQRLGVAQAIMHNPDILVLDEPTSGLDPSQINEMRSLLRSLSSTSTVIISTHILQEVEAMCDRVIIIYNGEVAADANLEELRSMNCVIAEIDKNNDEVQRVYRSVEGVLDVRFLDWTDGRHRYEIKTRDNPLSIIPRLSYTAISSGWQLFQIGQERRTLEAVFREINISAEETR